MFKYFSPLEIVQFSRLHSYTQNISLLLELLQIAFFLEKYSLPLDISSAFTILVSGAWQVVGSAVIGRHRLLCKIKTFFFFY